jgi:hypothetical protein
MQQLREGGGRARVRRRQAAHAYTLVRCVTDAPLLQHRARLSQRLLRLLRPRLRRLVSPVRARPDGQCQQRRRST